MSPNTVWYYASNGRQIGPLTATQLRAAATNGDLRPDDLIWREGLASWVSASKATGLFPDNSSKHINNQLPPLPPNLNNTFNTDVYSPPRYTTHNQSSNQLAQPASKSLSVYKFYKDPSTLTSVLTVLLYSQAVVSLISILSDIAQLALLGSSNLTEVTAAANDARQVTIGGITLFVNIVTGIVFLVWINRANKNCHNFTTGMEFTSGWSVGWYFVPIMCLYKPFQVMSEIWRVSHDPVKWNSMTPPALLRWWWGIWIFSIFLTHALFRTMMKAESIVALQSTTVMSIFSSCVDIALCIVTVTMISRIFKAQKMLVN